MKRITGGDELNAIASLGLGNSCMKDENGVETIEGRAVTSEEQPLIEAEVIRLNAAWDAVQYMIDRAEKYPRIQKQLDMAVEHFNEDRFATTETILNKLLEKPLGAYESTAKILLLKTTYALRKTKKTKLRKSKFIKNR